MLFLSKFETSSTRVQDFVCLSREDGSRTNFRNAIALMTHRWAKSERMCRSDSGMFAMECLSFIRPDTGELVGRTKSAVPAVSVR
jgi:hypothetical protein